MLEHRLDGAGLASREQRRVAKCEGVTSDGRALQELPIIGGELVKARANHALQRHRNLGRRAFNGLRACQLQDEQRIALGTVETRRVTASRVTGQQSRV